MKTGPFFSLNRCRMTLSLRPEAVVRESLSEGHWDIAHFQTGLCTEFDLFIYVGITFV